MPATLSVANDVDLNSRWNVIVIALISLRTLNAQTSFNIYVVVRMESIISRNTHSIFRRNQMIPHESHLRFMMCSNVRMNMLYVKIVIVKLCLSVDLFLSSSNTFSLFLFVVVFYHCTKWQNTRKHAIVTSNKFTVKAIIQLVAFGSFVITLSASVKMSSSQSTNQQQLDVCVCVPQPFK